MPVAFRLVNYTLANASSREGNKTVFRERKRLLIRGLSVPITHCKITGETRSGMSESHILIAKEFNKRLKEKKKN